MVGGCRVSAFIISIILFCVFLNASSEEDGVKEALVEFIEKLSPGNLRKDPNFGWNTSSDPCKDNWHGVTCDTQLTSVRRIILDHLNLTGPLDAASLCKVKSLFVVSLNGNNVSGEIPEEISDCQYLTHLYLRGNFFSGNLPANLSRLRNLKRIDLSDNDFSGHLPDLSRISGLLTFFADNNELSGGIPYFDFSNLVEFNVSFNDLSGPIPDVNGKFNISSFLGNPGLCGDPKPNDCQVPPPPVAGKDNTNSFSGKKVLVYSGYCILGLAVVLLVAIKLMKKKKAPQKERIVNKPNEGDTSSEKSTTGNHRSEFSITSTESAKGSSSLVVLSSPEVNGMRFEDLLQAPAELIGRGKHGSLYKVVMDAGGMTLAVKRIRNWGVSRGDFKKRMQRMDLAKHSNVLPALAYYCSKQEKLLVYEFQENGSLFKLLHGSQQNGHQFDWGSRISVAASTSEALAFMHNELRDDSIAHGNLKSSNILFNQNMEPCISEYGLMVVDNSYQDQSGADGNKIINPSGGGAYSTFKVDVHGFGVMLLELLTGKMVQNNGVDLAKWVQNVVREEWTVEVFDKGLVSEGASEERMVNLLQVALKCINTSPEARPSMGQVATMIYSIKEDEERSIVSDP